MLEIKIEAGQNETQSKIFWFHCFSTQHYFNHDKVRNNLSLTNGVIHYDLTNNQGYCEVKNNHANQIIDLLKNNYVAIIPIAHIKKPIKKPIEYYVKEVMELDKWGLGGLVHYCVPIK